MKVCDGESKESILNPKMRLSHFFITFLKYVCVCGDEVSEYVKLTCMVICRQPCGV